MNNKEELLAIPHEVIANKIILLRGQKVMIDSDIAKLYKVETKRLNEQVKRNRERFPETFMFQLTEEEFDNLKSQNATSSWGGRRTLPYVFTEHGILMLANILKNEIAIKVSIRIIEVFVKIRKVFSAHQDIILRLNTLEGSLKNHESIIVEIYRYIKQIEEDKRVEIEQNKRQRIGYKSKKDETKK